MDRKKYFPLVENKTPIENPAKKLTDFGYNFSPVAYQNNNDNLIYFVANRDGYSSLYKMKLTEKNIDEDNY